MSEWITDRRPTAHDCIAGHSDVWVYDENYKIASLSHYQNVWRGEPWQPISRPAPYVKPKRWTVGWSQKGTTTSWTLYSYGQSVHTLLGDLSTEAAERIADIYNEVLP